MQSLAEHDRQARRKYSFNRDPKLNGIACPKCGAELLDSQPGTLLTSFPPKKNVACSACDYTGYRIA